MLIPAQGLGRPEAVQAAQGRTPPWTGRPCIAGRAHTHPHTLAETGTSQTRRFTQRAQLQDVGGNRSPWRNPTQTRGEGAHSTQTVVPAGS